MSARVAVGFTLQPEETFLALCAPLLSHVDYAELAPETLWRYGEDGALLDNGYFAEIGRIVDRAGVATVAHGVGLSLGTVDPDDEPRLARWLARWKHDHARFSFQWASDHLGATTLGGLHLQLPVAVPMSHARARAVRRRLSLLRAALARDGGAPIAAVETTANHIVLGDPLQEPAFLAACTEAPGTGIVLDLHNVWTMSLNLGFDVDAWLQRLPLERVVEIHVSGGSESDPEWLPSRRALRLDSHDGAVPEPVWVLLQAWAPRCPQLRGVTLERMEGTVDAATVPLLRRELARVHDVVDGLPERNLVAARPPPPGAPPPEVDATELSFEHAYARALCAEDAVSALKGLGVLADEDGARVTALLIAKLRFERLVQGSHRAAKEFADDPEWFAGLFRAYHRDVPPTAQSPSEEDASFEDFTAGRRLSRRP